MDWFPYDNGLRLERVKTNYMSNESHSESLNKELRAVESGVK